MYHEFHCGSSLTFLVGFFFELCYYLLDQEVKMTAKRIFSVSVLLVSLLCFASLSFAQGSKAVAGQQRRVGVPAGEMTLKEKVSAIFSSSCAGCHGGQKPRKDMRLEPGVWEKFTINVTSSEREEFKIIAPGQPEQSYLLKKIRGDRSISGDRMPPGYPLNDSEIQTIHQWIASLSPPAAPAQTRPHFWAQKLINLPTTHNIKKKEVMFLVSHRFNREVGSGIDSFFGLDGPAVMLLGLGYGISDSLGMVLSRSSIYKEVELAFHWKIVNSNKQKQAKFPVAVVLHLGGSLVTQEIGDRKLFDSHNLKLNAQLSISYALTKQAVLLLVPSYTSNANHWDPDPEATLSLGLAGKYNLGANYALIAEWIPVISGYKSVSSAWGIGIEKKIGRHAFQVFVTNSVGLTPDQYIPGGDLKLKDGDFRLGFNIFRMF